MERPKAFYPAGTEKIFHIGKEGNEYRLDAIDVPIKIKEKLQESGKFNVITVDEKDDSVLDFVHSESLIKAYKTGEPVDLANSSGIMWNKDFYQWVVNKASATIKAANEAIDSGKSLAITSGGHHAEKHLGRGFGPISNMVIAAKNLLQHEKVKRIAILDLDVHYANGTHSLVVGDERILSCDLWKYKLDKWAFTPSEGNIYHHKVENSDDYFGKLELALKRIKEFNPDLLFFYDGLDPLENDRMGGVPGFTEEVLNTRDQVVRDFISLGKYPVCIFIGGGYIDYSKTNTEVLESKNHLVDLFIKSISTVLDLDD